MNKACRAALVAALIASAGVAHASEPRDLTPVIETAISKASNNANQAIARFYVAQQRAPRPSAADAPDPPPPRAHAVPIGTHVVIGVQTVLPLAIFAITCGLGICF